MLYARAAASAQRGATGSPETPLAAELGADGASASGRTGAAAVFPLAVRPGQRYLVDAAGRPFFIQGDAAWSLIAGLTREEVDFYLDDRRARGFNTILVSLIETRFASNAPANAYGELRFRNQPFETFAAIADLLPFETLRKYGTLAATLLADYGAPNEDYFAHADWVLLEPDSDPRLLVDDSGPAEQPAARARDRSFAIVYVPGSREFAVDLEGLAGPRVAARWYDPVHGRFSIVEGSPFAAAAPRRFSPEPDNGSGADDWVLVLESHS